MFDDLTLSDFDDCSIGINQESMNSIQKSTSLGAIPYLHESEYYHNTKLGLF